MFTWICPKCGREVPPAYSDCPNCAPEARQEGSDEGSSDAPPPPLPYDAATLVAPAPAPAPVRASGRVAVPGWLLSVMFALVFLVIGLTFFVIRQAGRAAPPPAPSRAAQLESAAAIPATQADPAFKDLELIGFRLTEDGKQKAFVQFVAINHSGADLGKIGGKAELQAITPRGKDPVGTFAFETALGPYESKDLKVPVTTSLRVYELPDWQFLRADITGR
jgi:hypothetical protein